MPPRASVGAAARLRRLSSQGGQLQQRLLQKSTAGSDQIFGKFAVLATHHPVKLFVFGHVVALAFSLGLLTLEKATDINDLWIDTDSRVQDEKKDFERKFGGVGRDLAIALQARGAGGVGTETALAAHQSTLEDLFTANITEHDVELTEADFCEKPLVPTTFQANQPSTSAYILLSQCLAISPTFKVAWRAFLLGLQQKFRTFTELNLTWGIDSFPCIRGSALDCFQEGGEVDYPPALKTLEGVAPGIAFAKSTQVIAVIQQMDAAAAATPTVVPQPCWLTSVPSSSDCIQPGASVSNKITVFKLEAHAFLGFIITALSSQGASDPQIQHAIAAGRALNASVAALSPSSSTTANVSSAIADIQTYARQSDSTLDLYLRLKTLRQSATDLAFADEVQRCKRESVASVISQSAGTMLNATALDGMIQTVLGGGGDANTKSLANNAILLNSTVDVMIDAFGSFGFWWRPSYKGKSPQEILNIFKGANESDSNSTVTVEQCIAEQSQGRYCCLAWDGSKVGMQIFLGNVEKFNNGTYKSVSAYQTAITNYDDKSQLWREVLQAKTNRIFSNNQQLKLAERFENEVMITKWIPKYDRKKGTGFASDETYKDYRISFVTTRSLSDILDEGTDVESGPVLISYLIMIVFICFTLGKVPTTRNCQELIDSHMLLGLYGLFTVAFSTVAGLGFSAIVKMKFTPITSNLAPFVSLGLGVDDMFVLVQSMNHQFRPGDSLEDNMIRCMHLAGPSVFLTSIANTVAFFIMASTPTTVIYLFGLSAAINVIFNFLLLHLIFVPAIVFDTRRMMANRLDVFLIKVTFISRVEPITKGDEPQRKSSIFQTARKRKALNLNDFVAGVVGEKLKNPIVKACILITSTIFTAVMIWAGVDRTKEGLEVSDIAHRNTYQHDMSVLQSNTFPFENTYLMATSSNFSDLATQQEYLKCLNNLSTNPWLMVGPTVKGMAWYADSQTSLLGTFAQFANTPAVTSNTPIPPSEFRSTRLQWLSALGATQFPNLVCVDFSDKKTWIDCRNTSSYLDSAKVSVYFDNLHTVEDYRNAMKSSRKLVDPHNNKNGLRVFMIGNMYYFYEQYLHMNENALRTTGLTLLGVFVITFIFQFSPMLSTLVCAIVACVVIELWGFFTFIDIKLNPFSVANLAISVGMAVEFTAHIARAFAIAKGTHDERMVASLKEMMVPMYQGAVSTIVSMAALADAKSPFFRIYYSYTFIVMIFIALVNGLFVLPVLLSLVGPAQFGMEEEDEEALKLEETDMPAITENPNAEEKV